MKFLKSLKKKSTAFRFLIIGAGRGGTSLIAALMDAHPEITAAQELFAFDYLLGEKTGKGASLRKRLDLFLRSCTRESKGHKLWGNKITTEQIHALDNAPYRYKDGWQDYFYKRILRNKKIVYIIRDGRTCVRSKINRTGQDYQTALRRWKYSVEFYTFLKKREADMLMIKMEELIEHPEETLKLVCGFLNVPYDPLMMKGTANTKMQSDYRRTGFDKSVTDTGGIPAEWYQDMKAELESLGYA